MIDLYYWPTPNGWKISIALEELGLPYRLVPVNIGRGDQFQPDFLSISPNNRIPAIVDPSPADGAGPFAVFESGAILVYLADKAGRLLPAAPRPRSEVLQWLMWQMGGLGPMLGQLNHFKQYAPEPLPYAIERYTREAKRLYGVLDRRLSDREYVAGDYSIADIAAWPWIRIHGLQGIEIGAFSNVKRWYDAIAARPAVQRGVAVGADLRAPTLDEAARRVLFEPPEEPTR